MNRLVAIVGPTAVGKSRLALSIAQTFGAEIVGADSRQVYRYMDIGTAKPGARERALVPHHLIDVVDPDEVLTLALYQEMAYRAIEDIQMRGKLPLLVGGSGLYIWAVLDGWQIPPVPPDQELRCALENRAQTEGKQALYLELERLDPVAAGEIDPRNLRRVIRALEVCWLTGKPFSQLRRCSPPPFQSLALGLTARRERLYLRIDSRIDGMIERGLVEEVRGLVERGYDLGLPSMSGIGYREIGHFLGGEVELETAIQRIKYETHRLVRHQGSWFRLKDRRIHWFDVDEEVEKPVHSLVEEFVESGCFEPLSASSNLR